MQISRTHAPGQSQVLARGLGYGQQVRGWGRCEAVLENCYKTKQLMDKSGIDSPDHVTSDAMELANQSDNSSDSSLFKTQCIPYSPKRGKETPLENLFVHLKVFTQVIHQVTHLLNQYH